jgi:hypothetical protein
MLQEDIRAEEKKKLEEVRRERSDDLPVTSQNDMLQPHYTNTDSERWRGSTEQDI